MTTDTKTLIEATQRLAESIDSIDGVANAVIFEAAQRLDELHTALQSAHASLVLARNERDEARAEVEERKDALLDAAKQIDELKKQRDVWLHKARQENEKLLNVRVELERLKIELDQAVSERTPHDYGLLAIQRDDYRERLGVAAKDVFELEAKVKLLTTERDGYFSEMERMQRGWNGANQEVLRLENHTEDLKKVAVANLTAAVALVRPEPSRLEIAAMIMAGGVTGSYGRDALCYADCLIAEEKKAK
jgi:hypothetical protein